MQKTKLFNAFFLTLLGSFILVSCAPSGEATCADFKTGVFEYNYGNGLKARITRTETEQFETNEDLRFSDVYQVGWTGDCNYYCVIKKTDNDSLMPYTEKDTIFFTITHFADDGYFFTALDGGKEFKGKLTKVGE